MPVHFLNRSVVDSHPAENIRVLSLSTYHPLNMLCSQETGLYMDCDSVSQLTIRHGIVFVTQSSTVLVSS